MKILVTGCAGFIGYHLIVKLNNLGYKVYGILNLDTGCQNVFQYFDSNGKKDQIIKGSTPLDDARNLLVYYFE